MSSINSDRSPVTVESVKVRVGSETGSVLLNCLVHQSV